MRVAVVTVSDSVVRGERKDLSGESAANWARARNHEVVYAHTCSDETSDIVRALLDACDGAEADLVICRAGAVTIAELSAGGMASILVPFPHAVDDHQTHNARFLSDQAAAVLLPQNELTPRKLADLLLGFTRERLLQMARLAHSLGKPDATRAVAEHCMAAAG